MKLFQFSFSEAIVAISKLLTVDLALYAIVVSSKKRVLSAFAHGERSYRAPLAMLHVLFQPISNVVSGQLESKYAFAVSFVQRISPPFRQPESFPASCFSWP